MFIELPWSIGTFSTLNHLVTIVITTWSISWGSMPSASFAEKFIVKDVSIMHSLLVTITMKDVWVVPSFGYELLEGQLLLKWFPCVVTHALDSVLSSSYRHNFESAKSPSYHGKEAFELDPSFLHIGHIHISSNDLSRLIFQFLSSNFYTL